MEDILRPLYQERASRPATLGILLIEKIESDSPITDTFDAVLLVITKEGETNVFIKHYVYEHKKAALHVITEEQLREWITLGSNRKIFDWIYNGRILFERNDYLSNLKQELQEFPFEGRKLKIGLEFAKLIRRYMDGKLFFDHQQYLDAYNHVIHSLHHLGRLSVIEKGFHPEVTVWNQVKHIEPEIYKLYEELITSEETLDKRLELLFLASDFLIHSKTKLGASHILEVLEEKDYWTIQEIIEHKDLRIYSVDLVILVEYLIEKKYIHVVEVESKGIGLYHRYYTVKELLS